jgi:hypothetical protein
MSYETRCCSDDGQVSFQLLVMRVSDKKQVQLSTIRVRDNRTDEYRSTIRSILYFHPRAQPGGMGIMVEVLDVVA